MNNRTDELKNRLLFTILIVAIYLVGRSLLLFNIDSSAYDFASVDSQNLMQEMLSGDRNRCSIFALGIMPCVMASFIFQIFVAIAGQNYKKKLTEAKVKRITFVIFIIFAVITALSWIDDLKFLDNGISLTSLKIIAFIEMMIGGIIIYMIAEINKKKGIGGQSMLILINISASLISTIVNLRESSSSSELKISIVLCISMMAIAFMMDFIVIKTPVQRVSIHSAYAEKDYIGYKLNPTGVMPILMATALFSFFQVVLDLLIKYFPNNNGFVYVSKHMNYQTEFGIWCYLGIVFALAIAFAFLMLMPGETADQLQENGDSIVGVYAGKKTKKYLCHKLLLISAFSGVVLSGLMGISLFMALNGVISTSAAFLPSSAMLLVGLLYTIGQELITYIKFDTYSFFI